MRCKLLLGFLIALSLSGCTPAIAAPDYEALSRAINRIENGPTLVKGELYGIHTVHYRNKAHAKKICKRTCKTAWKRYKTLKVAKNGIYWPVRKPSYIEYLSMRYCPVNHDNWARMVNYYYQGGI